MRAAALAPLGVAQSAARLAKPAASALPLTETRRRGARALRCRDRRARVPRWHARRGVFHGRPRRDDVPHPAGDVDRLCDNGCAREQSAASPAPPIRAAPRRCLLGMSPGAAGPPRLRLCGARAVMPLSEWALRQRASRHRSGSSEQRRISWGRSTRPPRPSSVPPPACHWQSEAHPHTRPSRRAPSTSDSPALVFGGPGARVVRKAPWILLCY